MTVDETVGDVLVLEDNAIFSMCLVGTLENLGYKTTLAVSTEEAREAVQGYEFYAAILDNECPGQRHGPALRDEGIRYAYELRESHPEMKVAMHTTTRFDQQDREYIESKGITLIEKGADEAVFRQFLE